MMRNMMDKIRGRKEIVVEKKGFFGRTKIEVTVVDRKGNVLETRVEKKERERNNNRENNTTTRRTPMTMEAKLEARRIAREQAKLELEVQVEEKENKMSKKAMVAGISAGVVVGVGGYATSRYKKVVERDNLETKETLDLEGIQDLLD